MYCPKCGGKIESYANNCAFCGTPIAKYDTEVTYVKKEAKEEKKGMTMWRWIGFYCLSFIHLIGFIVQTVLIFKWAFSKHDDVSLKGFARALILLFIIFAIIFVAMYIFIVPQIKFEACGVDSSSLC